MAAGRLVRALAPVAWRAWTGTWRCNEAPAGRPGPLIYACLHRDILPAIRYCRPVGPTLLVSKSPDGQILARVLGREGFRFVRGSTGHDGREGYVGLLRVLRAGGVVGVAVDGPRGPFGHVHPGALQLARRSGAPIVALTITGRRCLRLRRRSAQAMAPVPCSEARSRTGMESAAPAPTNAASPISAAGA